MTKENKNDSSGSEETVMGKKSVIKKRTSPIAAVGTKVRMKDCVMVEGTGQGHMAEGEKAKVHKLFADKMISKGVVRMARMIALLAVCLFLGSSIESNAQTTLTSSFGLASDTVTNAATGYVQARIGGHKNSLGFVVAVTKISGTVAGTITLQGSNDNSKFVILTNSTVNPNIVAHSAIDGSANYAFWINNSPYLYYRVSWTGTGTMSAKLEATVLAH